MTAGWGCKLKTSIRIYLTFAFFNHAAVVTSESTGWADFLPTPSSHPRHKNDWSHFTDKALQEFFTFDCTRWVKLGVRETFLTQASQPQKGPSMQPKRRVRRIIYPERPLQPDPAWRKAWQKSGWPREESSQPWVTFMITLTHPRRRWHPDWLQVIDPDHLWSHSHGGPSGAKAQRVSSLPTMITSHSGGPLHTHSGIKKVGRDGWIQNPHTQHTDRQ